MSDDEILKEAKRKYPPGTEYMCALDNRRDKIQPGDELRWYDTGHTQIDAWGRLFVYYNGKWADIISKKESPLEEAKRRYTHGIVFNNKNLITNSAGYDVTVTGNNFYVDQDSVKLSSDSSSPTSNWTVYKNGEWAKILDLPPEKTMSQDDILRQADKMYPVGTTWQVPHVTGKDILVTRLIGESFKWAGSHVFISSENYSKNKHTFCETVYHKEKGWGKIVNTDLPNRWALRVTKESHDVFSPLRDLAGSLTGFITSQHYGTLNWGIWEPSIPGGYEEISLETFKKHVLKDSKPVEKATSDISSFKGYCVQAKHSQVRTDDIQAYFKGLIGRSPKATDDCFFHYPELSPSCCTSSTISKGYKLVTLEELRNLSVKTSISASHTITDFGSRGDSGVWIDDPNYLQRMGREIRSAEEKSRRVWLADEAGLWAGAGTTGSFSYPLKEKSLEDEPVKINFNSKNKTRTLKNFN